MVTHTDPKVHMGTITGGEARELYAANPVVLLPLGSHEDQGPHAMMGDYLLAEKMSEMIALKASRAGTRTVVAPVLPYGGEDFFGPMIGGMTITPAILTGVITDLIASLHRNGLTRVIVINGHGGNVGPIYEVTRAIYRRSKRIVPSLYLWRIAYPLLSKVVGAEQAGVAASHGSDPLTSVGLHLYPEFMRPDMVPEPKPMRRLEALDLPFTGLGTASFEGAEVAVPHEYDEVYNLGVGKGDPRFGSAETGEKLTEMVTDICARFVAHFSMCTA